MNKFDDSLQHHEYFPGGHLTLTRCESCMYGHHFDEVTWHSWAGPDDLDHAGAERGAVISEKKCACDCAGPKEATPNPLAGTDLDVHDEQHDLGVCGKPDPS